MNKKFKFLDGKPVTLLLVVSGMVAQLKNRDISVEEFHEYVYSRQARGTKSCPDCGSHNVAVKHKSEGGKIRKHR